MSVFASLVTGAGAPGINYTPVELLTFIIAVLAHVFLLAVIWHFAPRNISRYFFCIFIASQLLWISTNYGGFIARDPVTFLWTVRFTLFFASLHSLSFFLFIRAFLEDKNPLTGRFFAVLLGFWALVASLTLSPFIFSRVEFSSSGELIPQIGIAMLLFGLFIGLCVLMAFYSLIEKYRHLRGRARIQLSYLTLGLFLTFLMVLGFSFLNFIFFKEATTVRFAHLYVLPFVVFTSFAMVKHRLLDIRPLIARTISFLLLTIIVAIVYALALFLVVQKVADVSIDRWVFLTAWALTSIAMLTFQPLQNLLERLTRTIFFREQYDPEQLLAALTNIMIETIDLDALTTRILTTLTREMRITKAALLLIHDHTIRAVRGVGYPEQELAQPELEELIHLMRSSGQQALVFEYLEDENVRKLFRKYDIVVSTPLRVENEKVALLLLGPKASGDIYSESDVTLLTIFAGEAGVAIQNAKAYTEIKRFSKELERRVEERTRQLRETQERELTKAQDVARLKDEFVFIAAHELRTPITAIRGFLEMVAEAKKDFPKDAQENLNYIAAASNHLNQLVEDLLEIARSEAGVMKVAVEPTDIAPLVEAGIGEVLPLIGQRRIQVQFHRRGTIPRALVDAKKFKEVIMNILSNAVKYNRDGGEVDVNLFAVESSVVLEIRDTGYGIPMEQQDKIFQKFFRARGKETQEVLGTGLGLFITRMLVEKMGGQIQFSSLPQEGTTFAILLQAENASQPASSA